MDTVFAVREATSKNLAKIIKLFGTEWATKMAIPRVLELKDNQNYFSCG